MARKDGKDRGIYEYPKASGVWWAYYVDAKGNRHREKVGVKTKARQRYLLRKAEVAEGRHTPPGAKQELLPTLAEAIDEYLTTAGQGKRSWRDDRNYAKLWTDALGKMTLDEITPPHVEKWKVAWGGYLAPASVNRRLSFLRRIFNVAARNGHKVKNPVSAIGLYRENNCRERYLKPDELARLVAVFPAAWWHVVEFALHTGLRQAEQFCLRWEDIDLQVNMLKIPRSKHGKVRHVPLNGRALELLVALKEANTPGSPWVFTGQRSRGGQNHLCANWFCRAIFTPALQQAGITDLSWHDLSSILGALADAGLPVPNRPLVRAVGAGKPSVIVLVLPDEDKTGDLEMVCLESVSKDAALPCLSEYLDCLQRAQLDLSKDTNKRRLLGFLASRPSVQNTIGGAARAGYWAYESQAFAPIRQLLEFLNT